MAWRFRKYHNKGSESGFSHPSGLRDPEGVEQFRTTQRWKLGNRHSNSLEHSCFRELRDDVEVRCLCIRQSGLLRRNRLAKTAILGILTRHTTSLIFASCAAAWRSSGIFSLVWTTSCLTTFSMTRKRGKHFAFTRLSFAKILSKYKISRLHKETNNYH